MTKLLSYILLLGFSITAQATDIPDFSATYQVKLNGIQAGELSRSLTTSDTGLREFSSISQAKGLFAFFKPDIVKEFSQWHLVDGFVQPQYYRYLRTGGKKEKDLSVAFNWSQLQADIDDKKHPWQLDIEPYTLDKLVYQISLMRDLASGKQQFSYRIADGGKLKTYHIKVLGEETISTPMGDIQTLRLTRERNKPKDRHTTLWCAPALNYLPVKLQHIDDDTRFTALLKQLEGIDYQQAFRTPKNQAQSTIGQP